LHFNFLEIIILIQDRESDWLEDENMTASPQTEKQSITAFWGFVGKGQDVIGQRCSLAGEWAFQMTIIKLYPKTLEHFHHMFFHFHFL